MYDMPPEKLIEYCESIEAQAHIDFFQSAPPEYIRAFRLTLKQIGGMWISAIPVVDNVSYNRVLGLGVHEPATESILDEAIEVFREAKCDNYSMQVCPLVVSQNSPDWFAARGFTRGRNWAKTYRGNDSLPDATTDLRVEGIGAEYADVYADIVSDVFGITPILRPMMKGIVGKPGWFHYLAFDGLKPVACASMFLRGELAWLGFMATYKSHRKRGAQTALTVRCFKDGMERGCKWFIGETKEDTPATPNPSFHVMMRTGFKLAYLQRSYYHQIPITVSKKVRRAFQISFSTLKYRLHTVMKENQSSFSTPFRCDPLN